MPRRIHIALSVNIDRYPDAVIARDYLASFQVALGTRTTVADVRAECVAARARGWDVFPPCDQVDERGRCRGHHAEDQP